MHTFALTVRPSLSVRFWKTLFAAAGDGRRVHACLGTAWPS